MKRIVDKLTEENMRRKKPEDDGPDEVEIMLEKPLHEPINAAKSAFDRGLEKRFGGLNTAPSVFDRRAVFKTEKSEEE